MRVGPRAVFAGSIIAAILAFFLSALAGSLGPSPGALPAAACIVVALVGLTTGFALMKLEDRVRALEARHVPPDKPPS
jgi:hypothetical protein